jgi:hypothetical protein
LNEVWNKGEAERLLGGWQQGQGRKPDYVVDAIDNIDSKVALLKYCKENGIKVVSSMGAGCKSDPTRVLLGDISASKEDPLSRSTRRRLRAHGISDGIPVVYSTEKPGPGKATLLPLPDAEMEKGSVDELSVLPDFRARILPVLGTMPAVFGYVAANFVLMELSGYPHEACGTKGSDKMNDSILQSVQGMEERLARAAGVGAIGLRIAVTKADVAYLIEEVFRARSVVSGLSTRLTLVRWRTPATAVIGQPRAGLQLPDLVCMTKAEAAAHERTVLLGRTRPEDVYDAAVVELVRRRQGEEAAYAQYR